MNTLKIIKDRSWLKTGNYKCVPFLSLYERINYINYYIKTNKTKETDKTNYNYNKNINNITNI